VELAHVWSWYCELAAARSGSGFGPNPIGYRDITEWARLSGLKPGRFEIECLLAIEASYFDVRSKVEKEKGSRDRSPR